MFLVFSGLTGFVREVEIIHVLLSFLSIYWVFLSGKVDFARWATRLVSCVRQLPTCARPVYQFTVVI